MQEEPSSSPSSSSKWNNTNSSKLQFFLKMRRFFLNPEKPTKSHPDANEIIMNESLECKTEEIVNPDANEKTQVTPQKAVKELLFGNWEEKENAAQVINCLASKDVHTRKTLAELGVIPPLVSMVGSDVVSRRCLASRALTQLADGTFTNKALILEAGILSKLPSEIDKIDETTKHDISQLLFSISSLSNTQFPLNPSKILPFLLASLQSKSSSQQTKEYCLGTLYNLSAVIENSGSFISNRIVDILLSTLSSSLQGKITENALATLGNLVVTLKGKKALEDNSMVPECLIDILTWDEKPKCQELSAYVLMVLAHQSSKQREKMSKAGIVHVLLEVALLGSPLAQKRALKLLQWFKDERHGTVVGPHSGPQTTRQISMGSPARETGNREGKRLMKSMVQQSLYKNMEVITRRANASGESSKLKSLVISSSSKSLPY
ncbi:uncharacterized protein LOC141642947 [Silene latifolia]|uniref:uncharacterized protein LOC141642947 n=1 Tax=Silene latifolia TaxID=37657 RepID=UPI003D77B930